MAIGFRSRVTALKTLALDMASPKLLALLALRTDHARKRGKRGKSRSYKEI
jgi:hypothetical protein